MGCCGGSGGGAFWPRRGRNESRQAPDPDPRSAGGPVDPLAPLKARLAKGEITMEEYQRLVDVVRA